MATSVKIFVHHVTTILQNIDVYVFLQMVRFMLRHWYDNECSVLVCCILFIKFYSEVMTMEYYYKNIFYLYSHIKSPHIPCSNFQLGRHTAKCGLQNEHSFPQQNEHFFTQASNCRSLFNK